MYSKEIYLIRHGETDYNRKGVVQGRGINVGINDLGRKQALSFYEHHHRWSPEIVLTSSLQRTHDTVERFLKKGIAWRQFEELDEISWGIYEGAQRSETRSREYRELMDAWYRGDYDRRIPGGESARELGQRLDRFVHELRDMPQKRILICSHGRAMRALMCSLLGLELKEMKEFPHQNLSLYVIQQIDREFELVRRNVTYHLQQLT